MVNSPKWATPDRQQHLVTLFIRSRGFCVFGHKNCTIPEHHYEIFIDGLVKDWVQSDREQRNFEARAESRELHKLGEPKYPLRGTFSAISREIYGSNQPLFYIQGLGMSGVTLTPFAKIRISSSYLRLYVDMGDILRDVSKNKKRKAIRYGKPLPMSINERISLKIREAVKNYLAH